MDTVIRYLEVFLCWPVVVLIVAFYFRKEIKNLADRVLKLPGAEFAPSQPPLQATISNPEESQAPLNTQASASETSSTSPQNARTIFSTVISPPEQLDPLVTTLKNALPKDPDEQVDYLLYYAAALHIKLAYERNYMLIFGSQIRLLKKINERLVSSKEQAHSIYNNAASLYKDFYKSYSFESWLGFVLNVKLIELQEEGMQNLTLTSFGKGFLSYILEQRLLEEKPF